MTYVGSATSSTHDQILDTCTVGPIPLGVNKFVLQSDPPDISLIPPCDVLGVTVVLLGCGYKGQEFVRVGYYVNNAVEPLDGSALSVNGNDENVPNGVQQPVAMSEDGNNEDGSGEDGGAAEAAVPFDASRVKEVTRTILEGKPRVTRFPIDWGKKEKGEMVRTIEEVDQLQNEMD